MSGITSNHGSDQSIPVATFPDVTPMSDVLTDRSVAQVKPRAKRLEIADAKEPGLYLIVQPSGVKSWAARTRNAEGQSKKITLGKYPTIPLAMARTEARKRLQRAKFGYDSDETLAAAIAEFELKHVPKLRPSTQLYTRRVLARVEVMG